MRAPAEMQSFTVNVKDPAVYRTCLLTIALATSVRSVPNFVSITQVAEEEGSDRGCDTGGHMLTLSEEHVRGVNLEEMARLWKRRSFRQLTPTEVGCIAMDVLRCLTELHQRHCIIHGAVHLQNILLDTTGGRAALRSSLFMQECLAGEATALPFLFQLALQELTAEERANPLLKLYWCAPEVFSAGLVDVAREVVIAVSFAADIFSLGVALLHLVLPHQRRDPEGGAAATLATEAPSTHDRVVACVQGLQQWGALATPVENSDLAAMAQDYGDAFLYFLAGCVCLTPQGRMTAAALLETEFLRNCAAATAGVHPPPLAQLMESVEEFMRDPVADERDWVPPTANTADSWASPLTSVLTQPKGEHTRSRPVEAKGSPVIVFTIPDDAIGSAVAPSARVSTAAGAAEEDDPPLPKRVLVREADEVPSEDDGGGVNAMMQEERDLSEDCSTALQDALAKTHAAVKGVYHQERRQLVLSNLRAQRSAAPQVTLRRPPSSPQTPASLQGTGLSPRAVNNSSGSNPHWTPRLGGGASPQGTPGLPRSGPSPTPPQPPVTASSTGLERTEAMRRAEKSLALLQRMTEELAALQQLSPDFARKFCEEFASQAVHDLHTVSHCVAAVEHLVPPIVVDERAAASAAAAAEEAARVQEVRRRESRIDFSKPLRTAEGWSQALSMPQQGGSLPGAAGGAPQHAPLVGVGGGAAALLYNKWLKEHQRKATHMV